MMPAEGLSGFDNPAAEDFADFVARTSQEIGRIAYALTGDGDRAADLAERAYARVRPRWGHVDEAAALQELHVQVLRVARDRQWDGEALDAVPDVGWPDIAVSAAHIDRLAERLSSRRLFATTSAVLLGALGVGAGVWQWLDRPRAEERATGVSRYPGFTVKDTVVVPLEQLTLHLDLIEDPERRLLAVRHGDVVIGTTGLEERRFLRLDHPSNGYRQVVVAISTPVMWMAVHDWPDDPTPMTLVSIGGQSVGLAVHGPEEGFTVVVGGVASGDVLGWPAGEVAGLRFSTRPDWAYLVSGTLVVREGTGLRVARSRGFDDLQVVRLDDGAVVFAIAGSRFAATVTGPGAEDVEFGFVGFSWIGLRPAGMGPDFPTLRWTDGDEQPRSLVLDGKL